MKTITTYYTKGWIGAICITLFFCCAMEANAQTKRVNFGGLGRSVMFYDNLGGNIGENDTTTADKSFNGYTLMDLAIDIKPNKATHIEADLRLRNNFGGFYGAGVSLDIRKLLVEGIIKDKLKYKIGDFNFKLSPYSFNYHQEELSVNEPTIFQDFKDILYYESLISDTAWRQQGFLMQFGLQAEKGFRRLDFMPFITRTRSASIGSFPERFFSGIQVKFDQSKYFYLEANVVDLFDLNQTSQNEERLNNLVASLKTKSQYFIKTTAIGIDGEIGMSNVSYANDDAAPTDLNDMFFDAGVFTNTDIGLSAKVGYKAVGVGFTSAGAQTKRIDWSANTTIFNEVTNAVVPRGISFMDIYYDENLYNRQIQQNLGAYNPSFSNAQPYGAATPNRKGLSVEIAYKDPGKEFIEVSGTMQQLSEIVGSGSSNLKNFLVLRGAANFHLNKLISYDKNITFTLGGSMESTKRSGSEFSSIQLNSNLIETGIELELAKGLDLLYGMKWFMASGNEFLDVRNRYNQVDNFSLYQVDIRNVLMAAGLKYRFNEDIYLTGQFIHDNNFNYLNPETSYQFGRFMILYNMQF